MRSILRIQSNEPRRDAERSPSPRRWLHAGVLPALWVGCAALLIGCGAQEPLPDFLKTARVVSVVRTDFIEGPEDVGLLRAKRSRGITSEFGGRIVKMHPEGEMVKAGDPVVWLDDKELTQNIQSEEINVKKRRAQLNRQIENLRESEAQYAQTRKEMRANLEHSTLVRQQAELEVSRLEDRFSRRLIPEDELLRARETLESRLLSEESARIAAEKSDVEYEANHAMIQRSIAIATAEFEQSSRSLESYRGMLEKAILRAPIDGIVVHGMSWQKQKFKVGDQIWEGVQVCEIPDLSEMEVVTQVAESDYRHVSVGQPAIVRVSALDGLELPARVDRIASLAVPRAQSRGTDYSSASVSDAGKVFELVLALEATDPRFRQGMGVEVTLVTRTLEQALVIPSSAVFRDAGVEYVFVRRGDSFRRKPIVSGARTARRTVVDEGVRESDEVAVVDPAAGAAGNGAGA